MQEDLYSPSLQGREVSNTKSYNIGSLFIVAFFGGVVGVSVLGLRNAKWLRLERKFILLLLATSVGLFVINHFIFFAISNGMISMKDTYFDNITKGFGILTFMIYYFTLKKPYKEHLAVGGDTEVMFGQGVLWIVISVIIEVAFLQMLGL
jgi:hypothetical protein